MLMILGLSYICLSMSGFEYEAQAKYFNTLPTCSDNKVAKKIKRRFSRADRKLWHKGVKISSINKARERAYNIYPDSQIDQRYCRARAFMSDGKYRPIYFLIERSMGISGFSWGVEYCLKGSDRWHAYGGNCRVLRK